MRIIAHLFIVFLVIALFLGDLLARGFRPGEIPNGNVNRCANCHIDPAGGGPRNAFGIQLFANGFIVPANSGGHVQWGPIPASLDADGDGVTNGEELGDPFGFWKVGDPAPGNTAFITLPGDVTSAPFGKLTIKFNGMNPHVGQRFSVRVIDRATGKEATRGGVASIPGPSFDVVFENALLLGHDYRVDFYSDHNGNGLYDAPPTDHAWRLYVDQLGENANVEFTHNTDFLDIDWKYQFTLAFAGMTPHVGQMLEMRVIDATLGREVGRTKLDAIATPDFNVSLPVLTLNHNYRVDFYADLNGNGLYDIPGTDHAWRLTFGNTSGDVTMNFVHNVNFTDIGWNYLLRMQFGRMNPHLGQLFEVRLVDDASDSIVNLVQVPAIPVADFAVDLPGLIPGKSYHVDFYADHNGNGRYDAPPTDHAWRVSLGQVSGNVIQNFMHNTNFTDISNPTSVPERSGQFAALPGVFRLLPNFPNPFNPETTIGFELDKSAYVRLEIFNTLGQPVKKLLDARLQSGAHQVSWDGKNDAGQSVNSGIYFYTLKAEGLSQTRRMLLLR